jgi:DNA-binding response OmpR family regulator
VILESGGYEVAVCEEPKRSEAVREFQPDLVVMDILLPDISGYDSCGTSGRTNGTPPFPCCS